MVHCHLLPLSSSSSSAAAAAAASPQSSSSLPPAPGVPDEIQEGIQCGDLLLYFGSDQLTLDFGIARVDDEDAADANDNCHHGGYEVVDQGPSTHLTTGHCV